MTTIEYQSGDPEEIFQKLEILGEGYVCTAKCDTAFANNAQIFSKN